MASIYANGARGHHKFTLTVSQTGTSKEDNTSLVSFQFAISPVVKGYNWKYWGNSISYVISIDSVQYSGTIPDYDGNSTIILTSGNLAVPHNTDGTKSLTYSFAVTDTAGKSYTCGNASAEGTLALTRILRTPPALSPVVADSNPVTTKLTGNSGTLVRYFSDAAFTFTATAYDGATIAGRTTTCAGKDLYGESGVFEKVESGTFVFRARDSYGNSASMELSLPMIPYIPLTCNLANARPNAEGNMAVSVSGSCFSGSFGAKENTLEVYFRYREAGGSYGDWLALSVQQSENSYEAVGELAGLDYQKAYVFQAKAEDSLDAVETAEYTAKAVPVFDWGEDDFNVNGSFKMNGTPVADFIVEQGTSGNWDYRKWNSGIAECWFRGNVAFTYGTQSNGFYFGYGTLNYPFAFVDAPAVTYSATATSGYDFCGKAIAYAERFNFYMGSAVDLKNVSTVTVNAYVIGKWKQGGEI